MTTPMSADVAVLPKAKLIERKDYSHELAVIKLAPEEGKYNFKPGQYFTLGIDGIERAYSVASAPYQPYLEVFVELVPEGELTPRIWKLEPGDTVSIRPRGKGIFTQDPRVHHHLMLATVTGVSPYISMIRQYIHDKGQGQHFYVIFGASYQEELVYDAELRQLAQEHPECVTYVATVSRPNDPRNAGWEGETGRVNAVFEKRLEQYELPKDDTMIYACGHPGMIADVKEKVTAKGWKFKEERFWKE